MASIALKVYKDQKPLDWKTPVLTQFAMIGFSILIFVFLPESPCASRRPSFCFPLPAADLPLSCVAPGWLASKGKYEEAQKILDMKYKNVEGYDTQAELAIIVATIGKQQEYARESKNEGPFAIFKGLDGKRFLIGSWPKVRLALCCPVRTAPDAPPSSSRTPGPPAVHRAVHLQFLRNFLLSASCHYHRPFPGRRDSTLR